MVADPEVPEILSNSMAALVVQPSVVYTKKTRSSADLVPLKVASMVTAWVGAGFTPGAVVRVWPLMAIGLAEVSIRQTLVVA